jgi:hypothetical protein
MGGIVQVLSCGVKMKVAHKDGLFRDHQEVAFIAEDGDRIGLRTCALVNLIVFFLR